MVCADDDEAEERHHLTQLSKKDAQIGKMDGMYRSVEDEMRRIRGEVKQRQESEEQMRQVLKEYEKTISELISEKEKSKARFEAEREALLSERDQSITDLQNVEVSFISGLLYRWLSGHIFLRLQLFSMEEVKFYLFRNVPVQ